MSDLRTAAQRMLAAVEDSGHKADVMAAADDLRAALAQQAEPDLSRCPQCNGPADNGFDRSFPPSPYLCKKCMAEPVEQLAELQAMLRAEVDRLIAAGIQPQRKPLTEKEMYAVDEEARKNFRLSQKGPRGQQITYWDGLTPWLIRAVERAHGIKE